MIKSLQIKKSKIDELATCALDTLCIYHLCNSIFRAMLTERLKYPNWVENDLVIHLLMNSPNFGWVEERLVKLNDMGINIHEFANRLSGREQDFDRKVHDLLAEVHAPLRLIEIGASNITVLTPIGNSRTPDLKFKLNNKERYAEVKNVDSRHRFDLTLFRKLRAISFYAGELFLKSMLVTAKADNAIELEGLKADTARKLVRRICEELENGTNTFESEIDSTLFEVTFRRSDKFGLAFSKSPRNTDDLLLDQYREYLYLGNTYSKILGKFHHAFLQLSSFRKGDRGLLKDDYIYLNFMIDSGATIFYKENFESKFWDFVKTLGLANIVNILPNFPE